MKKTIIYILFTAMLFSTSCSKDFVELSPENFLNSEDFFETQDDFNAAVIAAYAKLQGQVGLYFELVEWRSDNLDLGAPTAGTQDRFNINKFQETSANGIIQDAWGNFYNGIFRANVITDKISGADFDNTIKKQFEAEARFLRAMAYFNIVRFWGDAPIILNEISAEQSLTIGRSPAAEVYQVIEDDLNFAISNLPSSYGSQDYGRASSGAAKALLGKVYLTQKKYTEAISALNEVVGQYSLLNNIADVFDASNESNNETIFSIRFDKEIEGEGHGLWFSVSDVSTSSITEKISNAYSDTDTRKDLIAYQAAGNLFVPGKFFDIESAATRRFGNDYILLRYSDVLLMLAEALNEQGYQPSGSAFDYLNDVRERANLGVLTSTELPDQISFRNAILNERFLEFPLERHRWFDLIRTNTAATQINSGIGIGIQSFQLLYPVPQAEIEKINNTDLFYQNEGY
jgi:starch-binding outer membrane protein, SusD/RagB family